MSLRTRFRDVNDAFLRIDGKQLKNEAAEALTRALRLPRLSTAKLDDARRILKRLGAELGGIGEGLLNHDEGFRDPARRVALAAQRLESACQTKSPLDFDECREAVAACTHDRVLGSTAKDLLPLLLAQTPEWTKIGTAAKLFRTVNRFIGPGEVVGCPQNQCPATVPRPTITPACWRAPSG